MSDPVVTIMRDQEVAQHVEDELSRLIDTASAPIFGIDTMGMITKWNQEATKILGWDEAEVAGRSLLDTFITEEFKEETAQVLCKALHGDEARNFELTFFGKSGWRHELLLNVTTRRDIDGQITGVIGLFQDITEARDRIAELETADVPIIGVSVDGLVTEWNRKAAELSGYPKEFTLNRALVEDFITSDCKSEVQKVLTEACHGVGIVNFEFPLVTAYGERIDILLNAITRRNDNGDVTGVVGIGQDVTRLREAMMPLSV